MQARPANEISAATRILAVLGHPVRHSASPAMQNAGLAALGIDCCYVALEVAPTDLVAALAGARAMRFIGLNLTVPHKEVAAGWVDVLDETAQMWGAVNTIRFESRDAAGEWRPLLQFGPEPIGEVRARGFNTDAEAIVRALEEDLGIRVAGARVAVLGAGGAGRTAALKLAQERVGDLYLINRTSSRAAELAGEIRRRFPAVRVAVGYPAGSVDLVLNGTSLGLRSEDASPLDTAQLSWTRVGAVYDMIYRPAETRLLREARAAGCRASNGVGMLLHQGIRALELWTGRAAPVQVMRRALELHLNGGPCN